MLLRGDIGIEYLLREMPRVWCSGRGEQWRNSQELVGLQEHGGLHVADGVGVVTDHPRQRGLTDLRQLICDGGEAHRQRRPA